MYKFNESFFNNIDSADKAYLLGFICADGNIYKRDSKHQTQLQISVRDYDVEILKHFINSLNSNHPIKVNQDKRRKQTIMNTVTFISDKVGEDLIQLSITQNKTFSIDYNKIFNTIDKTLWNAFLLGLFDGDGNIDYPKDGTISKSHVRLSGPINQLKQIQQILDSIGINLIIVEDTRKYSNPFGTLECKNTITKYCLLKYLYSNQVISLTRKMNNAKELIGRIENNVTNRSENKVAIEYWHKLKGE